MPMTLGEGVLTAHNVQSVVQTHLYTWQPTFCFMYMVYYYYSVLWLAGSSTVPVPVWL